MSLRKSFAVAAMLLFLAVRGYSTPAIVDFSGFVTCGPFSAIIGCSAGIPVLPPNAFGGSFGLDSSVPFSVTIGSQTLTVTNPVVGDVRTFGFGTDFMVWGDIPGQNARMEILFEGANLGADNCGFNCVDLPPSSFLNYTWPTELFYIRSNTSASRLPWLESYPDPGLGNPFFMDGTVFSIFGIPASVPEPSTWILLATGLVGVIAIRRRRSLS